MPRLIQGYNDLQTYCEQNNLHDILNQYSKDNILKPNEIARRSHIKVKWNCPKCGREYEATPDHRTDPKHPTSCPYCNKSSTSMPELIIYNYFRQIYNKTQHRNRELGFELDVVVPEIKVAIEYDGILYHGIELSYSEKAKNIQRFGYILIRIIGITYDIKEEYIKENNEHILLLNQDNTNHAKYCIKNILSILNTHNNISIEYNEDIFIKALSNSIQIRTSGESNNKLSDKIPNIEKYYDSSLNYGIKLNTISCGAHRFLNLSCPDCGHKFKIHISNIRRMAEHGACICPKCRSFTPDSSNKKFRKSLADIFPNIQSFWSTNNIYMPNEIRAEVKDMKIKLVCPFCKEEIERVPQQMSNNNYRRNSKLKCNYCNGIIPLEVTQDRTKRHSIK